MDTSLTAVAQQENSTTLHPPLTSLVITDTRIIDFFRDRPFIDPQKYILHLIQHSTTTTAAATPQSTNGAAAAAVSRNPHNDLCLMLNEYRCFLKNKNAMIVAMRDLSRRASAIKLSRLELWLREHLNVVGVGDNVNDNDNEYHQNHSQPSSVTQFDSEIELTSATNSFSSSILEPSTNTTDANDDILQLVCDNCRNYRCNSRKSLALHKRRCIPNFIAASNSTDT